MDIMTSYNNYAVLSALFPKKKFLIMTNMECELAKYAHNAFGAMKVNFANIIYDIADKVGADYRMVKAGMLLSGYINDQHLEVPGPDGAFGYGGTCFPKDLRALNHLFPTKSFEACMAENRNHRAKRGRQESTLDRDNSTIRPVVELP
jgi:UDPglucose 6-dehydrogenase